MKWNSNLILSFQRALSPPSSNNKNGLTSTKNNVISNSPPVSVAVSSSERSQLADPETGSKERNASSNIIYSHTGNDRSSGNIENSTDGVMYSRPSTRSYGADGTLLNKIGR